MNTKTDPIAFRVMNEIGIIDQLGKTLFERAMPDGLTMAQFIVLNRFVRLGIHSTPVELAQALQLTKATISSTLKRLEVKGFINSTPNIDDARSKRINITESGYFARNQAINLIADDLRDIGSALGTSDMESVLTILVKLRTFLDKRRNK
jgi:DNA-binding MarR family transcriptional regulator